MSDLLRNISPILVLLALIGGLIAAVVWFVFPFIVNSALNRIQRLLKKQNDLLEWLIEQQPRK